MDSDSFARLLMDEGRRAWQNPEKILEQIRVQEGCRIADLACGPGFFTIPLARLSGKSGIVYAVDFNPIMIGHLHRNLETSLTSELQERVKVIESDVSQTTIPDSEVDLIVFANVLHDIADVSPFFEEMKRILKPTGRTVDIDWHKRETEDIGPPVERRLTEDSSRKLIKQSGFYIVNALNAGPYHYSFICSRK